MEEAKRLATDHERSVLLKLRGYNPKTCAGKCFVTSRSSLPGGLKIIKDIEHHCGAKMGSMKRADKRKPKLTDFLGRQGLIKCHFTLDELEAIKESTAMWKRVVKVFGPMGASFRTSESIDQMTGKLESYLKRAKSGRFDV